MKIEQGRREGKSTFAYDMAEAVAKLRGDKTLICTENKAYVLKVMKARGVGCKVVDAGVEVFPLGTKNVAIN